MEKVKPSQQQIQPRHKPALMMQVPQSIDPASSGSSLSTRKLKSTFKSKSPQQDHASSASSLSHLQLRSSGLKTSPKNVTHQLPMRKHQRCDEETINAYSQSRSMHSLLHEQSLKSVKKSLTNQNIKPSISTGTLKQKQISEQDEQDLNSSSSIGKEDNINLTLKGKNDQVQIGKIKNNLVGFSSHLYESSPSQQTKFKGLTQPQEIKDEIEESKHEEDFSSMNDFSPKNVIPPSGRFALKLHSSNSESSLKQLQIKTLTSNGPSSGGPGANGSGIQTKKSAFQKQETISKRESTHKLSKRVSNQASKQQSKAKTVKKIANAPGPRNGVSNGLFDISSRSQVQPTPGAKQNAIMTLGGTLKMPAGLVNSQQQKKQLKKSREPLPRDLERMHLPYASTSSNQKAISPGEKMFASMNRYMDQEDSSNPFPQAAGLTSLTTPKRSAGSSFNFQKKGLTAQQDQKRQQSDINEEDVQDEEESENDVDESEGMGNSLPKNMVIRPLNNGRLNHQLNTKFDADILNSSNEFLALKVEASLPISARSNFSRRIQQDENLKSSRRSPPLDNFQTLNNRQELKRNIPFAKFDMGAKLSKKKGCQLLIMHPIPLKHVLDYFSDYRILVTLNQLCKYFRLDKHKKKYRPKQRSEFEIMQDQAHKILRRHLKRLLIHGMNKNVQRRKYWCMQTDFMYMHRKKATLYKQNRDKVSTYAGDISKDVDRTFPNLDFFNANHQGQQMLSNVLTAISNYNDRCGYTQGMNFLAGTLLLYLRNEEYTFWMMNWILVNLGLEKVLDLSNIKNFKIICFQLDVYIQAYMPALYDYFQTNGFQTETFASHWFLSLYCNDLPFDLVQSIIDVFLLEGRKCLIRTALALLKIVEEHIIKLSFENAHEFIRTYYKDIAIDGQTLMDTAFTFKITSTLLENLEHFYLLMGEHEVKRWQKRLQLQEDENGRSFWIVLPMSPEEMQILIKEYSVEDEIDILLNQNRQQKLVDLLKEMNGTDFIPGSPSPIKKHMAIKMATNIDRNHVVTRHPSGRGIRSKSQFQSRVPETEFVEPTQVTIVGQIGSKIKNMIGSMWFGARVGQKLNQSIEEVSIFEPNEPLILATESSKRPSRSKSIKNHNKSPPETVRNKHPALFKNPRKDDNNFNTGTVDDQSHNLPHSNFLQFNSQTSTGISKYKKQDVMSIRNPKKQVNQHSVSTIQNDFNLDQLVMESKFSKQINQGQRSYRGTQKGKALNSSNDKQVARPIILTKDNITLTEDFAHLNNHSTKNQNFQKQLQTPPNAVGRQSVGFKQKPVLGQPKKPAEDQAQPSGGKERGGGSKLGFVSSGNQFLQQSKTTPPISPKERTVHGSMKDDKKVMPSSKRDTVISQAKGLFFKESRK